MREVTVVTRLLRTAAPVAGVGAGAAPETATAARSTPWRRTPPPASPIVTLEPSCWSMLVDDVPALVDDPRAEGVAGACVSFERAVLGRPLPAFVRSASA